MLLQRQIVDRVRRHGSRFPQRSLDRFDRLRQSVVDDRGRLRLLLGGQRLLDPLHRIEHHAGVGVAVALGVLAEKPPAPRSLHEGFADRVVIFLARLGRAGGDRR